MYGTITTLVPLYLVFQDFPIDPNRLSSRWSSSMHGTSVLLTHFFDSKHMDVNDSATLMFVSFCIIKSKDWSIDMAERTWLNEPYHDTLYNGLLVGPTKMVTGAFKLASGKKLLYTRYMPGLCLPTSYHMHREGYCAKNKEFMSVHDIKF